MAKSKLLIQLTIAAAARSVLRDRDGTQEAQGALAYFIGASNRVPTGDASLEAYARACTTENEQPKDFLAARDALLAVLVAKKVTSLPTSVAERMLLPEEIVDGGVIIPFRGLSGRKRKLFTFKVTAETPMQPRQHEVRSPARTRRRMGLAVPPRVAEAWWPIG